MYEILADMLIIGSGSMVEDVTAALNAINYINDKKSGWRFVVFLKVWDLLKVLILIRNYVVISNNL